MIETPNLWVGTGVRFGVGCVAAYGLWRLFGPFGLVFSAPLFGVLLAKPIYELVGTLRDTAKGLAYAPVAGRHFEHRGIALDIVEDDRHHRWIRLQDVRKLIVALPRDAVLQRQFPDGLRTDGGRGARIRADALLVYLARSTDADAVRLRNWLDREVVRPAARRRERAGVPDSRPPAEGA